ncbi:MAG: putative endonuclease [Solirubrobacteraceae bacterium]|jgi:putative endonuclease|nr:putative endonuclease [Solirubrobacteraceae bacterium]
MADDPRRTLGRLGEDLARRHLERSGYVIVDANFRTRYGELDLVASNGRALVFCEVKTRRAGGGSPFESLHVHKQRQVRRMAREWLSAPGRPRGRDLRFDAIGVTVDAAGRLVALEHLEGAF